jgi:lysophospholipase L1-like esterase
MIPLRSLYTALGCTAILGVHAADFAIHDGDRVVFLGDSITEQRLYTTYIEAYTLTRHPTWNLTFRNVGWGGDTAWLRQRAHPDEARLFAATGAELDGMVEKSVARGLDRDVLPLKPTVVTVKFGMNDHSYQQFRPDIFRAYVRSQQEIAKVLSANGARVTFLTPQPIEEKRPDPDQDVRNQSLRQFSNGLKDVAAQTQAGYVDQFDPYLQIMMEARSKNPAAIIGGGDAVHPGPAGQTLMAWAVLKGLGATAPVSKAEFQAGSKAAATEGCEVSNVQASADGVSFDRLDAALPLPIDTRAKDALKLAPVLDELSQYSLRVTGLKEGTFVITIDGTPAATAAAAELGSGVNLTTADGPITAQAHEVLSLVFQKNDRFFDRWREVQLYSFPGWAKGDAIEALRGAELKRLDAEIAAIEGKLNEARKPKTHHVEVKPAGK